MRSVSIVFCLLMVAFVTDALFFGSGGGGGGCCGGCGGCGGGCGRKKSDGENDAPLVEEEEPFGKLSANGTDMLCNNLELKQVMEESMRDSMTASKKALSSTLESFGDRFVVVCSRSPFEFAVRHDTAFCAVTKQDYTCKAFAL
ncbi:hypothetical protein PFISCL1PPCAC_13838 [Pristionchus fissidentatus]|uniref:Ground-like domain-containing protein n=1 Tax=Pristionchus fissidentatus TaxID=1538716 RepID=A0AAV5VSW9_9BILA|nr:hypothetical protein PFISCL1PPCAC_13838 [Pristionchus fissidentatus]